jgi:ribosomal protein S18 acetylase RimI-like enzyme
MEIEIRRATVDEADAVAAIILKAFAPFKEQYTAGAFEYTTPTAEVVRGRLDEGPIWVAISGDEVIGTVSCLPEGERLYIRSMAIDPELQRSGIGQTLLDAIEAYAVKNGFERLYLYTTYVLPGARRLYEKNGFYTLRETQPEEWFDMGGLEMEKKLD